MRNERTSKRVAKDAARILLAGARPIEKGQCVSIAKEVWHACRRVAASALTQAADRRNDIGFDPRDGGKVGREFIPKSKQARKAMKGKLGKHKPSSSPFYPSAKPLKHGP